VDVMLAALLAGLVLHGTVVDSSGLPVPRALVYVDGTQISTETDAGGSFVLALEDPRAGAVTVFRDGFSAVSRPFDPIDPLVVEPMRFVLVPAPVADVVTVTAPGAATPPASTFALRPLDVVRTAGSAADVMRALQTLPGIVQADEGAGLYVRGGDTSEVLVLLDDAVVFHPYRQETPGGGLFGSVEPFLLDGVSFATGGFSARYGNALSAVLDMHGLGKPESRQLTMTMGLAGASISAALPIGERGGVRVSGNRSFPGLLFAVNGRPYEFNPLPGGWDVNTSAHYTSARAGSVKLFGNATSDGVGVHVDSLSFGGLLRSSTSTSAASLHWERTVGGAWRATGTAGITRYTRGVDVGVLDLDTTDVRASWRLSAERTVGAWQIRLGGDGIDARTHLAGSVPARGGDLGGVSGAQRIDVDYGSVTAGAYVEAERRWRAITTTAGGRVQRFDLGGKTAADPRLTVAIDTAPDQKATVSWGDYHQAPDAGYYAYVDRANGGLTAMRARHTILGYQIGGEHRPVHLRAEGYWKTYTALPLEAVHDLFSSAGYGSAHGLDLYAHLKRAPVDVIADYSWLDAERRWTPLNDRGKYAVLPSGAWRPDFDISHTAHVLARVDLTRALAASVGWRMSSGRLDTPVVGAVQAPTGFVPVFGAINSERLPHYERTDLTVSYLSQLFGSRSTILFAAVGNLFGRTNFFEHAYSADFTQRRPVTSATPRVVYFGATFLR
jgi:TonB-dependent receptor-like protein